MDDPLTIPPDSHLPVLRARIDAIDHDILQLLARRNGLVAEVARDKREHALPIRDATREADLLGDRGRRARDLGLSPEVIESLFRLVLRGSRDRQSALRAELPMDEPERTVAIIGGRGQMGGCLASLFGDLGHAVLIADLDTDLTPADAAAAADVVVISVPIDVTVEVIEAIGPRVRPECLLMDVTSIKQTPVEAMLAATEASVVGTHPLFGPSVHSLQSQRIVMTPGRGDDWHAWLGRMLRARGLNVVETTAAEHDRAMSVVQVLTHFSTEVMGRALAKLGVPIERTLEFTSPIYLMELLMTARHFAQSADLYAAIQMSNPATAEVAGTFAEAAAELQSIVAGGDREAFRGVFDEVRAFLGPFTEQAMEQSSFLIDRLVERS